MGSHIDQISGGVADHADPEDFDPEALADGCLHELEHTDDISIATEIAMDHLFEDPNYYKKLAKIEKSLSKEEIRKKNSTPEARAARRRYMASKKGAKANTKAQYTYRAAHPERYSAQQKARTDGAAGKGHKCARCGKPAVHKHHTSYEGHDNYVWLCHAHHVKAHHPKSDITRKSLAKSFGAEPFGPMVISPAVRAGTDSGYIATTLGSGEDRTLLGNGESGPLQPAIEAFLSPDDRRTEEDRQRSGEDMSNERNELFKAIKNFDSETIAKSMVSNEQSADGFGIGAGAAAALGTSTQPGASPAPAGDGRFSSESKQGMPGAADAGASMAVFSDDDRLPEQQMADGSESAIEAASGSSGTADLQAEVDKTKLSKSGVAAGALGNDDDHKRRAAQIAALRKSQADIAPGVGGGVSLPSRPSAPAVTGKVYQRGITTYYTSEDEYIAKAMDEHGYIRQEPSLGLPGTLLTKSVGCASCGSQVPAFLTVCPVCSSSRHGGGVLRKSRAVVSDANIVRRVRPNGDDDLIIP